MVVFSNKIRFSMILGKLWEKNITVPELRPQKSRRYVSFLTLSIHPNCFFKLTVSIQDYFNDMIWLVHRRVNSAWIGLTDGATEENFQWEKPTVSNNNNINLKYSNWGPSEPNDSPNTEDCVEFIAGRKYGGSYNGTWNDYTCLLYQPFICELPMPIPFKGFAKDGASGKLKILCLFFIPRTLIRSRWVLSSYM